MTYPLATITLGNGALAYVGGSVLPGGVSFSGSVASIIVGEGPAPQWSAPVTQKPLTEEQSRAIGKAFSPAARTGFLDMTDAREIAAPKVSARVLDVEEVKR